MFFTSSFSYCFYTATPTYHPFKIHYLPQHWSGSSFIFFMFYLSFTLIYYFALFLILLLLSSSSFVYFNSSFLSRLTRSLIIVCVHPLFSLCWFEIPVSPYSPRRLLSISVRFFVNEYTRTHYISLSRPRYYTSLCSVFTRMHTYAFYVNERARVCIIHVSLFGHTLLTRYFILK